MEKNLMTIPTSDNDAYIGILFMENLPQRMHRRFFRFINSQSPFTRQ